MRVTGVKWTFDANGARKGNIHVDFTLTHPEEGLPWHKLHMTRYVTLPIQPKEPAAQRIAMNLNPMLLKEAKMICLIGYCYGVSCGHQGPQGPTSNKRKEKQQDRLRIANKYSKGEGSSEYEHPIPRIM